MTNERPTRPAPLLAATLLAWTPSARSAETRRYPITDLGPLPGQESRARGWERIGQPPPKRGS